MHSAKKTISLLLLLTLSINGFLSAQNNILKVASTLSKKDGKVPVYYPGGFEKTAVSLQALLQKAVEYYDKKLGVNIPVTLVLFTVEEDRKLGVLSNQPRSYNRFLPFVNTGAPNLMCLPVGRGSALDSLVQAVSKKSSALKKLKMSSTEISDRFIALVGFHELGHIYMNELEINHPILWYGEMMANYIAYAFLKDTSPADAELWEWMNEAFVTYLKPGNSLLLDKMGRSGTESYVWMQGNLTLKADEVYQSQGLPFLQKLKLLTNVKIFNDDVSLLLALDQIAPGFKEWADKEHHLSDENKLKIDSVENLVKKQTIEALHANMPNPFTMSYSHDWKTANPEYSKIAMEIIKDWEKNDFKNLNLYADDIEINFLNTNGDFERDTAIAKLKKDRSNYINAKIHLNSVMSLNSTDRNTNWVIALGDLSNNISESKQEKIDFMQLFQLDVNGKVNLIKFYRIQ
jgi:hypothetical protein